jgi:hypothetical protein
MIFGKKSEVKTPQKTKYYVVKGGSGTKSPFWRKVEEYLEKKETTSEGEVKSSYSRMEAIEKALQDFGLPPDITYDANSSRLIFPEGIKAQLDTLREKFEKAFEIPKTEKLKIEEF